MDDKELQTRKRLAKKLTALRKTLRKDERELLDALVAGNQQDVEGHLLRSAESVFSVDLLRGAYSAR